MQEEIHLNIVNEPMEHYTNEDDIYLDELIKKKKKGESYMSVVLKDDMKYICKKVMNHWYNIKSDDYKQYQNKYFNDKWDRMDPGNKGQLEVDEAKKFIRDFISAEIQL